VAAKTVEAPGETGAVQLYQLTAREGELAFAGGSVQGATPQGGAPLDLHARQRAAARRYADPGVAVRVVGDAGDVAVGEGDAPKLHSELLALRDSRNHERPSIRHPCNAGQAQPGGLCERELGMIRDIDENDALAKLPVLMPASDSNRTAVRRPCGPGAGALEGEAARFLAAAGRSAPP